MSQSQQPQKAEKPPRRTYSPEFRQMALDRMKSCSNVTELARELKIRRKWLYEWKHDAEKNRKGSPGGAMEKLPADECEGRIAKLQDRIAKLERLAGQQALDLGFFKTALRHLEEIRRKKQNSGVAASIMKSES